MGRLALGDSWLEYEVAGHESGEAVLLIHAGITADGLARPLLARPELTSSYRLIRYHRRGYGACPAGSRPLSFAAHAEDAAALLSHLGVPAAHVVGHSTGGIIALQLASDGPELVHSLALLEPALMMVPFAEIGFRAFIAPAIGRYRAGDRQGAVDTFLTGVYGTGWRDAMEAAVPGSADAALAEAETFFGAEMPALRDWAFPADARARVTQPILSVVGADSGPYPIEGRQVLHEWFGQVEDCDVQATNHLLQVAKPEAVAKALADFFGRHPVGSADCVLVR